MPAHRHNNGNEVSVIGKNMAGTQIEQSLSEQDKQFLVALRDIASGKDIGLEGFKEVLGRMRDKFGATTSPPPSTHTGANQKLNKELSTIANIACQTIKNTSLERPMAYYLSAVNLPLTALSLVADIRGEAAPNPLLLLLKFNPDRRQQVSSKDFGMLGPPTPAPQHAPILLEFFGHARDIRKALLMQQPQGAEASPRDSKSGLSQKEQAQLALWQKPTPHPYPRSGKDLLHVLSRLADPAWEGNEVTLKSAGTLAEHIMKNMRMRGSNSPAVGTWTAALSTLAGRTPSSANGEMIALIYTGIFERLDGAVSTKSLYVGTRHHQLNSLGLKYDYCSVPNDPPGGYFDPSISFNHTEGGFASGTPEIIAGYSYADFRDKQRAEPDYYRRDGETVAQWIARCIQKEDPSFRLTGLKAYEKYGAYTYLVAGKRDTAQGGER